MTFLLELTLDTVKLRRAVFQGLFEVLNLEYLEVEFVSSVVMRIRMRRMLFLESVDSLVINKSAYALVHEARKPASARSE